MKKSISASLLLPLMIALFGLSFASAQTTPNSCLMIPSNLSLGSSGDSVTSLQQFLQAKGFLTVAPTGYYGQLTFSAVERLQAYYGLPQVGVVGPLTRAAIQGATCASAATTAPSTSASSNPQAPQVQVTVVPSTRSTTTTPMTSADTPTIPANVIPAFSTMPSATSTATTTTSSATSSVAASTSTLPYKASQFNEWHTAWGSVSTTSSGALHLEGTLTNNGAEATYPASMDWTNYTYSANVSVANGNISLIARYLDSNNFLACSFANNWVEIDQVVDGTSTVLASKSVNGILPNTSGMAQTTSVSMDVHGDTVGCAGYGPVDNVSYTFPPNTALKSGGIGIESWYQTPLADKLDLLNVQVTPL